MKDLNLSTKLFDAATKPLHLHVCIKMQLAAIIEGITIYNMWLGWQVMTFIKLQILFKTHILQYV